MVLADFWHWQISRHCFWTQNDQGRTQGGCFGVKTPPLSLLFYKNFVIRRVYGA